MSDLELVNRKHWPSSDHRSKARLSWGEEGWRWNGASVGNEAQEQRDHTLPTSAETLLQVARALRHCAEIPCARYECTVPQPMSHG